MVIRIDHKISISSIIYVKMIRTTVPVICSEKKVELYVDSFENVQRLLENKYCTFIFLEGEIDESRKKSCFKK